MMVEQLKYKLNKIASSHTQSEFHYWVRLTMQLLHLMSTVLKLQVISTISVFSERT